MLLQQLTNSTPLPTLTPIVSCFDVVTVARPETGAVTAVNPTKLMLVTAVPTELPPNSSSTPEMTPVKFAPSP